MQAELIKEYQEHINELLDLIFWEPLVKPKAREVIPPKKMKFDSVFGKPFYYYVDSHNNQLGFKGYDMVWDFVNGFGKVCKDGKYNFVTLSGDELCDEWFDEAYDFENGIAVVKKNDKYFYIGKDGKRINNKVYETAGDFSRGYSVVLNSFMHRHHILRYNFVDKNGIEILDPWFSNREWRTSNFRAVNKNFTMILRHDGICIGHNYLCHTIEMHNYKVRKTHFGYKVSNNDEEFDMIYEPIMVYGSRYVLCYSNEKDLVYLFDRSTNKNKIISRIHEVEFDKHFIFDNLDNKVYFVYKDVLLDITEYYKKNLKKRESIEIYKDVDLESLEEFIAKKDKDKKKLLEQENEERTRILVEEKCKTLDSKYAWSLLKKESSKAESYYEGLLKIYCSYGYNFINTKDELICREWYEDAFDFCCGFARVKKDGKWLFINKDGVPINDEKYDRAWDFYNGFALVKKDGKYGYINSEGVLVNNEWHNGNIKFNANIFVDIGTFLRIGGQFKPFPVDRRGYFEYINGAYVDNLTKNAPIYKNKYAIAKSFHEGFAVVSDDGKKFYYIRRDGMPLNNEKYQEAWPFHNGYALVMKDGKYNFIDSDGNYLSTKWFNAASHFQTDDNNFAFVTLDKNDGGIYNYLNRDGDLAFKGSNRVLSSIEKINKNFVELFYDGKKKTELVSIKYLGNYKLVKSLNSTKYENPFTKDSFTVNGDPLAIYGNLVLFLTDKREICIYNRNDKTQRTLGKMENIEYDENNIVDLLHRKVYLVVNDQMVDITKYYKENLLCNRKPIKEKPVEKSYLELYGELKEIIKDLEKKYEESTQEVKFDDELMTRKEELYQQKEAYLKEYEEKNGRIDKEYVADIFNYENGYKVIKPRLLIDNKLRRIDLSIHSFKGAKIDGVDFSWTNVSFDPQTVYEKNLNGCDFTGVYFPVSTKFAGVKIHGCQFTCDDDASTLDIRIENFVYADYDENTTLNGESIEKLLEERKRQAK